MFYLKKFFLLTFLIVLFALIFILTTYFYKNHDEEFILTSNSDGVKVYVLLIDTGDPVIIDNFLKQGELPNFKKLMEMSSYSPTKVFPVGDKIISLPVIASIFTSRTPEDHGMSSHVFLEDGPSLYYPFKDLLVKPVWRILSEREKTVGILGTNGNYPVEKELNGFVVSAEYVIKKILYDFLNLPQKVYFGFKFKNQELIYPFAIKEEIDNNFLNEEIIVNEFNKYNLEQDFPYDSEKVILDAFQKNLEEGRDQTALRLAIEFLKLDRTAYNVFKEDILKMNLANHFYNKYKPDFFIEYLQGLDFYTMMYNFDEYMDLSHPENMLLSYYRFYDNHIGEIFNNIDNNTILIAMSDHGAGATKAQVEDLNWSNVHSDKGVFFITGNNILSNQVIDQISVYDIVPTILYLMELPVAKDMQGNVITQLFEEDYLTNHQIEYIKSYED